jgi:hypothetical protein
LKIIFLFFCTQSSAWERLRRPLFLTGVDNERVPKLGDDSTASPLDFHGGVAIFGGDKRQKRREKESLEPFPQVPPVCLKPFEKDIPAIRKKNESPAKTKP